MNSRPDDTLAQLTAAGVAVWLDDISRERLSTGNLEKLVRDFHVQGVTSNPTIFASAMSKGSAYDGQLADLGVRGVNVDEASRAITSYDIRWACDVLRPVYDETNGLDGRVSLEVDPRLARDTAKTIAEARALWWLVDRPNLFIKIPATEAGLPAITQCLSEGISVNVTLIFSLQRYAEVIDAFMAGLENAAGHDVSTIASVASFFVSRVDGKVDPLLDRAGHDALRGRIAIANACAAYRLFEGSLGTPRWQRLAQAGARPQRPLWASTSTKDPRYPDTFYVEALVAPRTVNTLPPETFAAYRDHGNPVVRMQEGMAVAPERLKALAAAGIDLAAVTRELEDDGVAKFAASYTGVLGTIETKAGALAVAQGR